MSAAIKCDRCSRRMRNQSDWNVTVKAGHIAGYRCPDCQTPEDYIEAQINWATIDYSKSTVDEAGRWMAPAMGES